MHAGASDSGEVAVSGKGLVLQRSARPMKSAFRSLLLILCFDVAQSDTESDEHNEAERAKIHD